MIDRGTYAVPFTTNVLTNRDIAATFTRMNPNYAFPTPVPPKDQLDAGNCWGDPGYDPRGQQWAPPAGAVPSRARGTRHLPPMSQMPQQMQPPMAPPMPRQAFRGTPWPPGMMPGQGFEDGACSFSYSFCVLFHLLSW